MKYPISLLVGLLAVHTAAWAAPPTVLVRPIAAFNLTLMPPGKGEKPFGWIELLDGAGKPSGYIYLEESDVDPHIGGSGTYVVTHLPYQDLSGIIAILQSVKPLQIRYFNSGTYPSVFIERADAANATPDVSAAATNRKSM